MSDAIQALGERIEVLASRMESLREERDRLREELAVSRDESSGLRRDVEERSATDAGRAQQRLEIIDGLREALGVLRGDVEEADGL